MADTPIPEAPVAPLQEGAPASPAPAHIPEPGPEAAPEPPVEGTDAGAEEKEAPWQAIKEKEGLKEHVQEFLEEAERSGYEKRTTEWDQYAAPYLQQQSQRLNDINAGLGRMLKGLDSLAKAAKSGDGGVDGDALSEWYDAHEDTLKAVSGEMQEPWQFVGAKRLLVSLAEAAGDQSLASPFMGRLDMLAKAVPDPNIFHDFLKKVSSQATSGAKKPLEEQIAKLKAENEGLKRKLGEGKGADLSPKSGRSGRYTSEQLKKMTPQQIMALPKEDVDRALSGG